MSERPSEIYLRLRKAIEWVSREEKRMRLIDADALTDSLDNLCDTVCQYSKAQRSVMCGACPLGGAFDVVDDAPTVEPIKVGDVCKECWRDGGNVVEVVRCKDCRHRDPEDHKCDSGEMERQGCPFKVADDYFCAYGERRSE